MISIIKLCNLKNHVFLVFCDKGFYSNAHQNSCMPCDIGYFKNDRGNALKCTGCPDGFLTPNIASTSAENCNERMSSKPFFLQMFFN